MEPSDQERFTDEQLDAALKNYGAVEPRSGLEGRVLANLRIERAQVETRAWRWWPALAVVTSMLLIGAAVLLKTKTHPSTSPLAVASQPTVPAAKERPRANVTAHGNEARVMMASRRRRKGQVVAPVPRLEQFPSPQPLSEQEALLARYIEQFPHEAGLVARAQTQLMKQEMMELEPAPESAVSTDSQQENR
jgi:hypothetical protein